MSHDTLFILMTAMLSFTLGHLVTVWCATILDRIEAAKRAKMPPPVYGTGLSGNRHLDI